MKRFNLLFIIVLLAMIGNAPRILAQEIQETPTDDLGTVSDDFQENFFEGLKQKAIENYELALTALERAEISAKENQEQLAVVYFEMGKNYKALERFGEAERYLKQVMTSQGERLDVMEVLYDLYFLKRDYEAAIPLVQKLMVIDEDYKEDLANLYSRTKRYEDALELLDELDESWGESTYRNALRRRIYRLTGNSEGAIKDLESKIEKNPKKEQDYLNLIYLYSEEGDTEKAFETAKELLKQQPNSELVHLALYKFYLEDQQTGEAMKSMSKVFGSKQIEGKSKLKVLNDFFEFVAQNPEYEKDLDLIISSFPEEDGGIYEQLGHFYRDKGNLPMALRFFKKGIKNDEDNFSLLRSTLQTQLALSKFEEALELSETGLATFPAQAVLYLLNGRAYNELNQPDKAIDGLEMGMDFILENPRLSKQFYEELSRSYQLKGNENKAREFASKAAALKLPD